jgi:hypothetical protein
MYYLFLDTECGGLDDDTSLLSLGMIVTDEKFDIKEVREWKLKPNDGIYKVTGQGLSINKIDLASHEKEAIAYKEIKTDLHLFLHKWCSHNDYKPLIPVGKNVYFDARRLWGNVISRGHWESMVSYQPFEINGSWRLLEAQGKVPVLPKTSLIDIANHFNISVPCTWLHTSVGDCRIYIEIMQRLVQL